MKRGQRGFTLLEVLIAASIMGIAIAGVMSGLSAATRSASRVTEYDRGAMLARMKMDELLVDDTVPRDVPLSGVFPGAQSGGVESGWQARVTPFEFLGLEPQPGSSVVDRVALEIWWMDGDKRRSFTLEGFRRGRISPGQTQP